MGMMHTRFVSSLMGMKRVGETHLDFKIGSLVYDSRNQIAAEAIQEGADRVLFIDSDMRFDVDLMTRMSEDLDRDGVRMVSALCFRRNIGNEPVIYKNVDPPRMLENWMPEIQIKPYTDYPRDSFFQIAGCGFGCVMIETSVLKEVWDRFGPPFTPLEWCGEDISFCFRLKGLDIPMHCDSRIKVGHIGEFEYNEESWLRRSGVK
jgi:hypothetical protein